LQIFTEKRLRLLELFHGLSVHAAIALRHGGIERRLRGGGGGRLESMVLGEKVKTNRNTEEHMARWNGE